MTQEELDDWREHPVTMALKAALLRVIEAERKAVERALWAGAPDADKARVRVILRQELVEDFFELSEADYRAAMETDG